MHASDNTADLAVALYDDLMKDALLLWSSEDAEAPEALRAAVASMAIVACDPIEHDRGDYLSLIDHENPELIWEAIVQLYRNRTDISDVVRGWEQPAMLENKYTGSTVEFIW